MAGTAAHTGISATRAPLLVAAQQLRDFNLPYQLGWTNEGGTKPFEAPSNANVGTVPVFADDIIVMATDGLFDNVAWRLVPLEYGDAKLQFIMIESINRTPPLIFPSYDEEKGWSLNGLLILKNFQGKNRSIELNTSFGGEKRIQLLFNDPWLFGDHISLSTYIENNSYEHLFLDQNITVNNIRMSIGKWYGENLSLIHI